MSDSPVDRFIIRHFTKIEEIEARIDDAIARRDYERIRALVKRHHAVFTEAVPELITTISRQAEEILSRKVDASIRAIQTLSEVE